MLISTTASDNRQFQVMLGFTGLNVLVAAILAIVRKRSGLFGLIPERKEGNEYVEAKIDQSGPALSGALAQDTCEKKALEIAAIHRPDDNAGTCLGKR